MLDSFKCLTYPEKNLDYSTPSPVDNKTSQAEAAALSRIAT